MLTQFLLALVVTCAQTNNGECVRKDIWIVEDNQTTLITEDTTMVFPSWHVYDNP